MRDDFLSADWANNHETMSNGIDRLIQSIIAAFATLAARQFQAPWQRNECDASR